MKKPVFLQQANLKKTTLVLSLVALMGTGLTACDKHTKEEHKHDEHSHAEHSHEENTEHEAHDHEHEHVHEHEEEHKHDEKVGHIGKHVHGEAELNAVIEGNSLNIELNSPSMNVFGFEHEPSTPEQKATVEKQEAVLENAAKLFVIDGGDCAVKAVKVNIPFDEHVHDKEHEHEAHHEADEHEKHEHEEHEHHHEDDKHEEHEHAGHHHAEGEVHSDVSASYSYDCKNGADVKSIKVQFFNQFTGFTKINTNWVNGDKQGAQTLTKDAYNIAVK